MAAHKSAATAPELALSSRAPAVADEIARELAEMGYLGRGKVLIVYGAEGGVRTSLHALRIGRHLARQGATLVIDLAGDHELYARTLARVEGEAEELLGLAEYLAGEASPGAIIHRDRASPLHLLPMSLSPGAWPLGPEAGEEIAALVELFTRSYALIILDAGAAGSAGEMLSDLADAFALFTLSGEESAGLARIAARLEARRGSPVFVARDEGLAQRAPANDRGFAQAGAA